MFLASRKSNSIVLDLNQKIYQNFGEMIKSNVNIKSKDVEERKEQTKSKNI